MKTPAKFCCQAILAALSLSGFSVVAAAPVITSFSPLVAVPGTTVSIRGQNFSPVAASNIVFFGATRAAVSKASATNLQVTVPAGATHALITETAAGLVGYSKLYFEPTFYGNNAGLTAATLGPQQTIAASAAPIATAISDLNGDGKPDIIVTGASSGQVAVFQNIGGTGALGAGSFGAEVDLPAPDGGSGELYGLAVADVDGDGRPDIIAVDRGAGWVVIYRNLSTGGPLTTNSFAPPVVLPVGSDPRLVRVGDLDGDGRPDVVCCNYGSSTLTIYQNVGTAGGLTTNSFAPRLDLTGFSGCLDVAIADLDGDGRPDLAVVNYDGNVLSLLQNISTGGLLGTNSFAPAVNLPADGQNQNIVAADLEGTGKLDLVTSANGNTVSVYHNQSTNGTLTVDSFAANVDFGTPGWAHNVAIGDLNGDGQPDICAVGQINDFMSVFQNMSQPGPFTAASLGGRVDFGCGSNPWGVSVGDLDGDGRPDVIFCNLYDNTLSIYQNQTLSVAPHAVVIQPASQTARQGGSAALTSLYGGTGPLKYQWLLNGKAVTGATNGTLTLTDLHPYQAGSYVLKVTSTNGTATSAPATVTVVGQPFLVYLLAGTETLATAGTNLSVNVAGEFIYNPAATNGTFIGWGVFNGKKQYWVTTFGNYQFITIPAIGSQSYTVFANVGTEFNNLGQPDIWSHVYKGLNTPLAIMGQTKILFPATFTANDTDIYPDPVSGIMTCETASSTFSYQPRATLNSNDGGVNVGDYISSQIQTLVNTGYKLQ